MEHELSDYVRQLERLREALEVIGEYVTMYKRAVTKASEGRHDLEVIIDAKGVAVFHHAADVAMETANRIARELGPLSRSPEFE
jgi:hypothetical protein